MESPRKMSVQMRPTAKQIQPTEFLGCLEAIRAPTRGKAKKETKINSSLRAPPVLGASCDEWARKYSTTLARNMATQRPASDQASQEAARPLYPWVPRSRSSSLVLCATTPLYRTLVCATLRNPLRSRAVSELRRNAPS